MRYLFSNEIVFRGHPDKVCDQISAAILRACMVQDKNTRAGIEVVGGKGKIFITGELTTTAKINVKKIARSVLEDVGYTKEARKYKIINNIGMQSSDIALGVDVGGAGDQGMMFGYACDDTEERLPLAMVILQRFAEFYDSIRRKESDLFLPDGKAQITGVYDSNDKLIKIATFLCSYQNTEKQRSYTDSILRNGIESICKEYGVEVEQYMFNPTGAFRIGGFEGDAGLTGRKIVVDAYHSFAAVGGGCMNGKDPTKVDFSAAHMARKIAVDFLNSKKLKWCEVQISYAIGKPEPLAIYIRSNAGEFRPLPQLYDDCKVSNIIASLHLREVNYVELAKYGHFRKGFDAYEYCRN